MVLVLGRGTYCPKDRWQVEGPVELHRELEVAYCRVVTISTDNITETNEYRSGVGAHWPFHPDAERMVQKDLDIAEYTDPVHNPMIPPHVIVFEAGLVIYSFHAMQASGAGLGSLVCGFKGRCRHFDVCRYHVDRFLQNTALYFSCTLEIFAAYVPAVRARLGMGVARLMDIN